jgi:hypothetical protein
LPVLGDDAESRGFGRNVEQIRFDLAGGCQAEEWSLNKHSSSSPTIAETSSNLTRAGFPGH